MGPDPRRRRGRDRDPVHRRRFGRRSRRSGTKPGAPDRRRSPAARRRRQHRRVRRALATTRSSETVRTHVRVARGRARVIAGVGYRLEQRRRARSRVDRGRGRRPDGPPPDPPVCERGRPRRLLRRPRRRASRRPLDPLRPRPTAHGGRGAPARRHRVDRRREDGSTRSGAVRGASSARRRSSPGSAAWPRRGRSRSGRPARSGSPPASPTWPRSDRSRSWRR